MKKILLSAVAVFSLHLLPAQSGGIKVDDNQKSTKDTASINSADPNDKAAWKKNGKNKAEYSGTPANKAETVTYDATGNVVVSEDDDNAFPPAIGEYYTHNYPGETFEVWSSVDPNGIKTYYISRKTEVLWFDKMGKFKTKTKVKSK